MFKHLKRRLQLCGLISVACLAYSQQAFANLMISPTRVVFEDRERNQVVNIINNSDQTKTYRIEIVNNIQTPDGSYKKAENLAETVLSHSADRMIRFSPKQVTLQAGQSQQVKLTLNKPENLQTGEYRTHLSFVELPSAERLEQQKNQASFKLFMLVGFSIPIQVRHNNLTVTSRIENIRIQPTDIEQTPWAIVFDITRTGNSSAFGRIVLSWRPNNNSAYQQIREINNIAVYRELDKRENFRIALEPKQLRKGLYKIEFQTESKHFKPGVFDAVEVPVNFEN
jgi:fimbrial chaperone protein